MYVYICLHVGVWYVHVSASPSPIGGMNDGEKSIATKLV